MSKTLANHYWGYFIPEKELIDIFVKAGGKLGIFEGNTEMSAKLAERSIFGYIWPGRIRVYYALADIDGEPVTGMAFVIGRNNTQLEKISQGLLERCRDMFLRDPDLFVHLVNPEKGYEHVYEWRRGSKVMGLVEHIEFVESNKYLEYDAFR